MFSYKLTVLSSLEQQAHNIPVAAICLQNLPMNNGVVNIFQKKISSKLLIIINGLLEEPAEHQRQNYVLDTTHDKLPENSAKAQCNWTMSVGLQNASLQWWTQWASDKAVSNKRGDKSERRETTLCAAEDASETVGAPVQRVRRAITGTHTPTREKRPVTGLVPPLVSPPWRLQFPATGNL